MQVICKLIDTDINSMAKYIDKLNLAGINKLDNDRDKFSLLKYVPNREEFVLKIKDAFTTDAIVKLLQAKVSSEEQLSIIDQELLPATEKLKKTKKQLKENKETRQKKE
jgi:lipid II:glycine glycyltransferase (peptidoglycan interpeptide bridge formation enzyme)